MQEPVAPGQRKAAVQKLRLNYLRLSLGDPLRLLPHPPPQTLKGRSALHLPPASGLTYQKGRSCPEPVSCEVGSAEKPQPPMLWWRAKKLPGMSETSRILQTREGPPTFAKHGWRLLGTLAACWTRAL